MKKNKKGFALIELLAVIVILGIIITIVVSNVVKYIVKARTGSYVDAYQIMIKDLRTQLLAKEMETGTASLNICNDTTGTTKCSDEYPGLYKKDNISLTISGDASSGYTITVVPTDDGSFKGVDLSNTTENNFSISGKTLSSKMTTDGTVTAD